MQRNRFFLIAILMLAALSACSGGSGEQQPAMATVTLAIGQPDETGDKGGSFSFDGIMKFTYADVTGIQIDVHDTNTSQAWYLNLDLQLVGGDWTGTIPFLPLNTNLTFTARALDASNAVIFSGSTAQTLTTDYEAVNIQLHPIDDDATHDMPQLVKITYPSEFVSGERSNVIFTVQSNAGDAIDYTITPATGGGTFLPASGTITLLNTAADFVSLYTPPDVAVQTSFTHEVSITDPDGITVVTTFTVTVVPPDPAGDGAENTTVTTLFNPVFDTLQATRSGTDVTWTAAVTDDGPQSELSYAWSFTPNGTFTPTPAFVDAAVNPAVLANYDELVQGTINLAVTDINGGTTTVHYTLIPGQFPNNPEDNNSVSGLLEISAGSHHVCALLSDGSNDTMRCWGYAGHGQLGYGNTFNIGDNSNEFPYTAGDVPLLENVVQIATGANHTCALLESGLVRCWGQNNVGQLGYGHTNSIGDGEAVTSAGYVQIGGLASQIVAGAYHTCALLESTGAVRCWGRNDFGQLGYGHTDNIGNDEPAWNAGNVDVGGTVKKLVAGGYHTCVLLDNGNVRCWGRNASGELGYHHDQNLGDDESPTNTDPNLGDVGGDVNVGGSVIDLVAGRHHTCALLATGYMRCWGYNGFGQLGYGHTWDIGIIEHPADVGDINTGGQVTQIAAGVVHTCAVISTGALKCWGHGGHGRLGYNDDNTRHSPPATGVNLGGSTAYQVTGGNNFTCALLSSGNAWCWGSSGSGQLGYGNTGEVWHPPNGGNVQIATPSP